MDFPVLIIFCLVYLGMVLGNWPGLALDRTGIALLGAIAFIEIQNISLQQAVADIDISSITMLFSFMIISAQLYFSGFYTRVAEWVENWKARPEHFLLFIILISGILSAALINDIVCLAMTPLLIRICHKKKFNPIPFLIGLACGSNIGSALTLIGNPQNMLIGQVLHIPFAQYSLDAIVPCVLGWGVAWWIIKWQTGSGWYEQNHDVEFESPAYDPWQSFKGIVAIVLLLVVFLIFNVPRDHISLAIAGFLLLSRKMASQMMLSFIDWQLLVLFIGLFIVNQEFNRTEIMQSFLQLLQSYHVDLSSPAWIFVISVVLSNLISNVPAVMLLLPFVSDPTTGSLLALSSTLAGNMFIVGSIANIIVISQAAHFGIRISWKRHLAAGLPISLLTLGITALWLYLKSPAST
jgi:Na+/H+ antiporter NhaD/arsenite permease-like protein